MNSEKKEENILSEYYYLLIMLLVKRYKFITTNCNVTMTHIHYTV